MAGASAEQRPVKSGSADDHHGLGVAEHERRVDVAVILGANDVVNPAAHTKGSAIYGMPIIEAYKAKTMMVFGDARKVVEEMVKAID